MLRVWGYHSCFSSWGGSSSCDWLIVRRDRDLIGHAWMSRDSVVITNVIFIERDLSQLDALCDLRTAPDVGTTGIGRVRLGGEGREWAEFTSINYPPDLNDTIFHPLPTMIYLVQVAVRRTLRIPQYQSTMASLQHHTTSNAIKKINASYINIKPENLLHRDAESNIYT